MTDLFERVQVWIDDDPDPRTREELTAILRAAAGGDQDARIDLEDRFSATLRFGTAGLRGALQAGPNRMNLAIVIRAAAGIARWVTDDAAEPSRDGPPIVVIGFDARHRSADFARVSAEVCAAHDIRSFLLPEVLPTPLLAHAVRELGARAGIMVTASHNPPEDNGYKVFDHTGRQIIAPVDRRIADVIEAITTVSQVPRADETDPRIEVLDDRIVASYVDDAASVGRHPDQRRVDIAYTAMHGVGAATFRRVLRAAGFDPPIEVDAQNEPDPDFPTVAFPNPEEPGALDLGLATAARHGADLLIAHDPDADRLGAAVPDARLGTRSDPASWRVLRGDEIGAILADHLLASGVPENGLVATTIVSSTLLARMAASVPIAHRETLTGFKWLMRAAQPDERLVFAYEEALGFAVAPDLVADKDGLTAAVLFAEAAAVQKAAGRSVLDVLDDLDSRHGVHRTGQWSARVDGVDGMARLAGAMAALRATPPTALADSPVTRLVDLADGSDDLPPSDVVIVYVDSARIVVRPSGTEPKLKCYLEVVEPVGDHPDGLLEARRRADLRLQQLTDAVRTLIALG